MSKSALIETAAQEFIDSPDETAWIASDLQSDLLSHYRSTSMLEHQPLRTDFLVTKAVRTAGWAALWHVVTDRVITNNLPLLETDPAQVFVGIDRTHGQHRALLDAGTRMLNEASSQVLDENADNPDRIYAPLWEQVGKAQDGYRSTWTNLNNQRNPDGTEKPLSPPFMPGGKDKIGDIWTFSAGDIMATCLWTIANWRASAATQAEGSPAELTNKTLQSVDVLNWATTMNRSVNLDLNPALFDDIPEDVAESFFTGNGDMFVAPDDAATTTTCRWAHKSLQNGPWPAPGNCAGRIWLTPRLPEQQNNARSLFAFAASRSGRRIEGTEAGRYDSGLAMLTIGALLAEHSIYQEES
jgi:hypothetical protein